MFYYFLYDEMFIDWLMNYWIKIKFVVDVELFNKLLVLLFEYIGVILILVEKVFYVVSDLEIFFDVYD